MPRPVRACGPSAIYLHALAFSGTGSVRSRYYPEPTLRLVLLVHLVWASSTQLGNSWSSLLLRRGRHRFGVEAVSYRRRAVIAGAGGGAPLPRRPPLTSLGVSAFILYIYCTDPFRLRFELGLRVAAYRILPFVRRIRCRVGLGLESWDPPPGFSLFPRSVFASTFVLG